MGRLSRKQREEHLHRMEILGAAERLFSSKGFYKTTMRDVAKAAEFGVGTVYKFFESKERLYLLLIENKLDEFHKRIKREVSEKQGTLEKVRALIGIWLEFFETNRDFFKIFISEIDQQRFTLRKRLGEKLFKKHNELVDFVIQIFQEGCKEDVIKGYDPTVLAYVLGGIVGSFLKRAMDKAGDLSSRENAEMLFQIFAHGVLKDKTQSNSRG